jgi:predicted Zn-dependent protease
MENVNYTLQENIQSLVNGELDEKTRHALLEQVQAEPKVADELAFSQSLARALRQPELAAASAMLSTIIGEEGFPPPAAPPSPTLTHIKGKWWIWAGVAVFTVLSLVGGYFWAGHTGLFASNTQKISGAVLQPLENVLFLPSSGQGIADLQMGMAAYEAGRYAEAARLLDGYVSHNPDNSARVYLGVAYLFSGQSKQAIPPLADVAQSPEPPIREAALWYLALAYLENNNSRAAVQALEAIPPDGLYGSQAQELLKKLK